MSVELHIYVGPYLEVHGIDRDSVVFDFDDVIYDGRGEDGIDDSVKYLLPNIDLPGASRQMSFSKDDEALVFEISSDDRETEMSAFIDITKELREYMTNSGIQFMIKWDIVCGSL